MFSEQKGFTLLELVFVIIIAGMMVALAGPRFFSQSSFDIRFFYDDVLSALRYAHQLAIATTCPVQFTKTVNGYQLTTAETGPPACTGSTPVINPSDNATNYQNTNPQPTGVTYASTGGIGSMVFNALGQVQFPNGATAATLTISNTEISYTIQIEGETGFVR